MMGFYKAFLFKCVGRPRKVNDYFSPLLSLVIRSLSTTPGDACIYYTGVMQQHQSLPLYDIITVLISFIFVKACILFIYYCVYLLCTKGSCVYKTDNWDDNILYWWIWMIITKSCWIHFVVASLQYITAFVVIIATNRIFKCAIYIYVYASDNKI